MNPYYVSAGVAAKDTWPIDRHSSMNTARNFRGPVMHDIHQSRHRLRLVNLHTTSHHNMPQQSHDGFISDHIKAPILDICATTQRGMLQKQRHNFAQNGSHPSTMTDPSKLRNAFQRYRVISAVMKYKTHQ